MRRRIFRLYGELKAIEIEFERGGNRPADDLLARLNRLEDRANRLHIPRAFASLLYSFRHHIAIVRDRLKEGGQ
jgi:hypothetical protein